MSYTPKNIPNGWALKKMPDVVKWSSGGTPKATEKSYYENGTIPWLIIGDLNDGVVTTSASKITELGLQNSSAKMIPVGTLLVAMYGSIGKLGITGIECCTNQAIAYAKELKGVSTKYMYYYMAMMKSELISQGKGGTQKNISQTVLNSLEVLVPPEKEQKRIVNKIEELFSELDSAVETLKKTKEQLAVYRQSVLKEAFEKYEASKKVPVTELVADEKYALAIGPFGSNLKVSDYTNNGVRLVFVKDIRNSFSSETTKYVSEAKATELAPHCVYQGDLLITKMGDPPGDCCVYPYAGRGVITSDCIRIKVDETKVDKMCLLLYIHSAYGKKQIKGMTQGVAQKKISLERFKKFEVPRIDILEQKELVKKIQSRMSVCENIEKTVNDALIQADAMRQSILKKAFEGGL